MSEEKRIGTADEVARLERFLLGEAVHVALSTAKPKARYAGIPQRFKNCTLPRLLPARMLDTQLAKALGLKKP